MKRIEAFFYQMLVSRSLKKFKQSIGVVKPANKYNRPHQGAQEKARRVRQLERGIISNYAGTRRG